MAAAVAGMVVEWQQGIDKAPRPPRVGEGGHEIVGEITRVGTFVVVNLPPNMKKTASSARYEMVQPGLMRRVRVFLPLAVLFLFAVVPVHALYIPCDPGTGLVDPNKVEPDVRECQPCQVKGCAMCTWGTCRASSSRYLGYPPFKRVGCAGYSLTLAVLSRFESLHFVPCVQRSSRKHHR